MPVCAVLTGDPKVTYPRIGVDDVFEALSHPTRRRMLDLLAERDGRALREIEASFSMTRFGVMKHLRILEEAGLVITQRVGRTKLHYLNPAPIQLVSDRWISRYAAPFAQLMSSVKQAAERKDVMADQKPRHLYEIFIRAPQQRVWDVLTDDSKTHLYERLQMASQTDWRTGGGRQLSAGGQTMVLGTIVELTPPTRMVTTFQGQWSDEVKADAPSKVTWIIEAFGDDTSKLTLIHDEFDGETATFKAVKRGWPETLSSLKTLLETGEPLQLPPCE